MQTNAFSSGARHAHMALIRSLTAGDPLLGRAHFKAIELTCRASGRVAGPSAAKPAKQAQAGVKHRSLQGRVVAEAGPREATSTSATSADASLRVPLPVVDSLPTEASSPTLQSAPAILEELCACCSSGKQAATQTVLLSDGLPCCCCRRVPGRGRRQRLRAG